MLGRFGAKEDDRRWSQTRLPVLSANFRARQLGHHSIKNDKIERLRVGFVESISAVVRHHDFVMTHALEHEFGDSQNIWIVFGKKNSHALSLTRNTILG